MNQDSYYFCADRWRFYQSRSRDWHPEVQEQGYRSTQERGEANHLGDLWEVHAGLGFQGQESVEETVSEVAGCLEETIWNRLVEESISTSSEHSLTGSHSSFQYPRSTLYTLTHCHVGIHEDYLLEC